MKNFSIFLFVLCTMFVVAFGKHIHPRSIVRMEEDAGDEARTIATDIDGMPIELIRRIKPSRFVPVNNVLFFQRYPIPCEEGFERDLLGVCREVWE